MADDRQATAKKVAVGAAACLVAGLVASFAMDRFQSLTQPAATKEGKPATQKAADGISRDVTGEPLSETAKPLGGQIVHYGLGTPLGVGYGIAAEFAPSVTAGIGTLHATGVWAALDEATVPALRLGDPPWKATPQTQAYSLVSHIVFGLSAEIARRVTRRAIGAPAG